VREYVDHGHKWYDIIYKSGRIYTLSENNCSKTVKRFIAERTPEEQYDFRTDRVEVIYR